MIRALFVAAVAVVVADACAHAPERVVDRDGSEVASVADAHPAAVWLPLQQPLGMHRMNVVVVVNGSPAVATIDTGATDTSMSLATARRLGLGARVDAAEVRDNITDAHGERGEARRIVVDSLALGSQWLEHVNVWIYPGERDSFLIGMDQLRRYDIFLDVEEGFIGLFPAGTGPRDSELTIPLRAEGNSLVVDVAARGRADTARAALIVDTGAESTMFPSSPAVLAGLDADLRFKDTTIGVLSTREQQGRFRIDGMRVGGVDVGTVIAFEDVANDGKGPGLLGIDVLSRFRTLIVTSGPSPALHLWRLPRRGALLETGPLGYACPGGCVRVNLVERDPYSGLAADVARFKGEARSILDRIAADQLQGGDGRIPIDAGPDDDGPRRVLVPASAGRSDNVCLFIDINAVYAGSRLEFAVTDDSAAPGGRLAGHTLSFYVNRVPKNGYNACLPLPRATQAMTLSSSTPLSLRFVRTDAAVVERCEADVCLMWTGP